MVQFDAKDLKFENGVFLGADDFIKGLRESYPSAFVSETTIKKVSFET